MYCSYFIKHFHAWEYYWMCGIPKRCCRRCLSIKYTFVSTYAEWSLPKTYDFCFTLSIYRKAVETCNFALQQHFTNEPKNLFTCNAIHITHANGSGTWPGWRDPFQSFKLIFKQYSSPFRTQAVSFPFLAHKKISTPIYSSGLQRVEPHKCTSGSQFWKWTLHSTCSWKQKEAYRTVRIGIIKFSHDE